jgi:hypothetical protein
MREYLRVLQGARMVAEQVVKRNGPELGIKVERAIFHLSELLKNVVDISQQTEHSNNTTSKSDPVDIMRAKSGDDSDNKEKLSIEEDLTGFSSIPKEDDVKVKGLEGDKVESTAKRMRERAVPSTQMGRMFGFGSLAVRMAASATMDRMFASEGHTSSMSDRNAERLAEALCRMRGAALKLGQMLSIQDEATLPPALAQALERVRQGADYMPRSQLNRQLEAQLGADWQSKFSDFNMVPLAAASIGQVHKAKLLDDTEVAMKIQYPGVAESIVSDLNNLKQLVSMTNLLPPGLFIDNIIKVAKEELAEECEPFSAK